VKKTAKFKTVKIQIKDDNFLFYSFIRQLKIRLFYNDIFKLVVVPNDLHYKSIKFAIEVITKSNRKIFFVQCYLYKFQTENYVDIILKLTFSDNFNF